MHKHPKVKRPTFSEIEAAVTVANAARNRDFTSKGEALFESFLWEKIKAMIAT